MAHGLFTSLWCMCRLLSSCGAWAPENVDSVVAAHGLSGCAHGLSCPMACGILVPGPGMELASPALQGGFLTTGPPGKSLLLILFSVSLTSVLNYFLPYMSFI